MPTIILNNAHNTDSMSRAADQEILESLSDFIASKALKISVTYSTSFEQLENQLKAEVEAVFVFTNCPPNSTYQQRAKTREEYVDGIAIISTIADAYGFSKNYIRELASKYPNARFTIITGAPKEVISDAELLQLASADQIKVKRKRDFLESGKDYVPAFTEYVLSEVSRWIDLMDEKSETVEQTEIVEAPSDSIDAGLRAKAAGKRPKASVTREAKMSDAPRVSVQFRVFVSSTFKDMVAERNALDRVFRRLQQFCREQGVNFQAIDLRWGISYEASHDQQTMNICLAEIRRCQATSSGLNFIALLGDRYGWRPLPAQVPVDDMNQLRTRMSVDEWEDVDSAYVLDKNAVPPQYMLRPVSAESENEWSKRETKLHSILARAADRTWPAGNPQRIPYECSAVYQEISEGVLGLSRRRVRAYCYLRKAEAGSETAEDGERLEQLKASLKNHLSPRRVHEYEIRRENKSLADSDLDAFCRKVEKDLKGAIRLTLRRSSATDDLDHEIRKHQAFAKERALHFRGRQALRRRVHEYLAAESDRPWLLHGPSGSGKSALMAKLLAEIRKRYPRDVIVWRSIGATPASSSPRLLLEGLCREMARAFNRLTPDFSVDDWQLARQLWSTMEAASPDRRLILLVDAVDQLSSGGQVDPLVWLPLELPANVRVVLSVLDEGSDDSIAKRLRGALSPDYCEALDPLTVSQGMDLLKTWLHHAGRTLNGDQYGILERCVDRCQLPLYLRFLFEECRQWHSYDSVPEVKDTLSGIVSDFLSRLEAGTAHGVSLVRHSLKCLAAARYGLSEDELLGLLSDDEQVMKEFAKMPESPTVDRLPFVVWSRLRFDLAPYITTRQSDSSSLLDFYHQSVAAAVRQHVFAEELEADAHRILARFFERGSAKLEQPISYRDALGRLTPNRRKLSELPFQQTKAGSWEALEATLCDLEFIQVKCAAGMVFDLIDDFQRGLVALKEVDTERERRATLESISNFVRRESRNLARWATIPGFVAQQAQNKQPNTGDLLQALRYASTESAQAREMTAWFRSINPENDPVIAVLDEFADSVTECAFSADGAVVVASSRDGTVRRWDIPKWVPLDRIAGRPQAMMGCDISLDGTRVVSACEDGHIRIHDVVTRRTIVCEGEFELPRRCRFLPDMTRVVSCGRHGVLLHDATDGRLLQYQGDKTDYVDLDFAPDGTIALAGYDGVHLLDPHGNDPIKKLGGGHLFSCSFSRDGRYLLAGGGNEVYMMETPPYGEATLWDATTWQTLDAHHRRYPKPLTACTFLANGELYVIGSSDGSLRIVELASGEIVRSVGAHSARIRAAVCSPDGGMLLTAGYDDRLKAWNVEALLAEKDPEEAGRALFCDIDSSGLHGSVWTARTSGFDCSFHRHDFNLGLLTFRQTGMEELEPDRNFSEVPMDRIHMDVISPKTIALVKHEGSWTAPHRTSPITFKQHNTPQGLVLHNLYLLIGWSARFMPFSFHLLPLLPPVPSKLYSSENLTWAAAVREEKYAFLRRGSLQMCTRLEDGDWLEATVKFSDQPNLSTYPQCEFSQDGRHVFFTWHNALYVVNADTQSIEDRREFGDTALTAFCESPDGRTIAVCGTDGTLHSLKLGTESVSRYEGHVGEVVDCAWLSTMKLVSIGTDATIRLWEIGQPTARALFVAANELSTLAVSDRRDRVLAADIQGQVYVLEVARGFATPVIDVKPKGAAEEYLREKIVPRLRQCAAHDKGLQFVAKFVFLDTKGEAEATWYVILDAGGVDLQETQPSALDMIFKATLDDWSRIIESELGVDNNIFGDSPPRVSGDIGLFGRLSNAWNETQFQSRDRPKD